MSYFRNRIGPNVFLVYYKNSACFRYTPIEVGRVFGCAKFTPWVKEMREWAKEMVAKYDKPLDELLNMDKIKKEGFGPEAHAEETEDPTANTKMIT